jgi:hypothetical protein
LAGALTIGSYRLIAYEGVHEKVVNYFTSERLEHG